jgi:hypothetical protein
VHPVAISGTHVNLREFRADDLEDSMAVVGDPEVTHSLASTSAPSMTNPPDLRTTSPAPLGSLALITTSPSPTRTTN